MGIDKHKAKQGQWRISENTLITSAFLMGGIGATMGGYVFRHKTKKTKFRILLPVSIIFNIIVIYLSIYIKDIT